MRVFKTFKLILLLALGTTLLFSCKQDLLDTDMPLTEQENAQFRKGQEGEQIRLSTVGNDASSANSICDIEVCIDIVNDFPGAPYTYSVQLPGLPAVIIRNGLIYPNGFPGPSVPYPNPGPFCLIIEVDGDVPVTISYQGSGAVETTVFYPSGNSEVIFQAGDANDQNSNNFSQDVIISCDNDEVTCDIEVCVQFTEDNSGGNNLYIVSLPGLPDVVVTNGLVYPQGIPGPNFPVPPNGEFCTTISVTGEVPVTIRFQGPGAVETTITYPSGNSQVIFQAGDASDQNSTSVTEELIISCENDPCEIEVCVQFTEDGTGGNNLYIVSLPGLPDVVITNGLVYPQGIPGPNFPVPPNGEVCTMIEVVGTVPVGIRFQGPGAVATTVTWPNGDDCTVFQAGDATDQNSTSVSETIHVSCTPDPC